MRIRNRLVGLLVGVLSLGGVVAMFPSGGAAAGSQDATSAAAQPSGNKTCDQAKRLATNSLKMISKYLTPQQRAAYKAVLDAAVAEACAGTLTCEDAEDYIAQLRNIRGNSLPPRLEAQLRAAEDEILKLVCSS